MECDTLESLYAVLIVSQNPDNHCQGFELKYGSLIIYSSLSPRALRFGITFFQGLGDYSCALID